jgi:hypothetical protein
VFDELNEIVTFLMASTYISIEFQSIFAFGFALLTKFLIIILSWSFTILQKSTVPISLFLIKSLRLTTLSFFGAQATIVANKATGVTSVKPINANLNAFFISTKIIITKLLLNYSK